MKKLIVMLGATGAVGGEALKELLRDENVEKISLLGRREVPDIISRKVSQHMIDIFEPHTYEGSIENHNTAICTLGVGEPSKVSKEDFIKIDKEAVLYFAKACKKGGIKHFELLSSVGISPKSKSFFLRTKGELVEALKALNFERLSIFMPSMILTPTNRYGFSQALTLAVWPKLKPLFFCKLKKYRGIPVALLGKAIAENINNSKLGYEELTWEDFMELNRELI